MNKKICFFVVPIILAILLISVTITVKTIEKNNEKKVKASALKVINEVQKHYLKRLIKNDKISTINLSKDIIKYDGDQVTKGYVTILDNNDIKAEMYFDGYYIKYENNKIELKKVKEKNVKIRIPITFPIMDGEEVYFNPNTNKMCLEEDVVSSKTGTKDGCMKWYAFLDKEENDKVKLLLDHNTTAFVKWSNDENSSEPTVLLEQLAKDAENWHEDVKKNARVISAYEINEIAPTLYKWKANDLETGYYTHTGTLTPYIGDLGTNKYGWLFDNVKKCSTYGCYNEEDVTWGYWTSTPSERIFAWSICFGGSLYGKTPKTSFGSDGLRPVIEVDKSIFY